MSRKILAVDFAGKGKGNVTWDGRKSLTFPAIKDVIDYAAANGFDIYIERNFANFEVQDRGDIIAYAASMGVAIRTCHPRHTARYRDDLELEKTDKNDAKVIYHMAVRTEYHFKAATVCDEEHKQLSAKINDTLMLWRRTGRKDEMIKGLVRL
jgi:transposase